jgi:uncharacterized protein DUF1918
MLPPRGAEMNGTSSFLADVGEWIVMKPRRPGQTRRVAEVIGILGDPGHELYRARWEDGTVSLVCRDEDLVVRHSAQETEEPVLVHEP